MHKYDNTLTRFGGLLAGGALALASCTTPGVKKDEPVAPLANATRTVEKPRPPPPPPEPTVAEKLGKAKKAYAAKDWAGARQGFAAVLGKDPKNLDALLLTAVSHDLEGQLDEAIGAYRKVLEVDADNEGALLNLGMVYRRRDRFDDAIKLYTKALEADPDNVKVRNNLGVIYRLAKKYDDSEKTLRRVLSRSPGNIDAYKNMAVLFLDQNKLALAEQFSIEARKLDEADDRKALPKDSGIWNNLGLIYFKKDEGKPTRAMSAFRKAAEINPSDATAQMNIGAIAMRYRDYATAEKSFESATRLEQNNPDAFLAHGFALDGGHKYKEALASYQKATDLFGKERCDVVWQTAMIHKAERDWSATYETFTHFKGMSCSDQTAEKVEQELKGADYMVKHPPAAPQPASAQAPQLGAPATPAPAPEPAPAPAPAADKKDDAPPTPALTPAPPADATAAPAVGSAGGGSP